MKLALGFFCITNLLFWTSAQAAVVDNFDCNIRITDRHGIKVLEMKPQFAVTRMILPQGYAPDVRFSKGSATLESSGDFNGSNFDLRLKLEYAHFMRVDDTGKVIKAGQSTCLDVNLNLNDGHAKTDGCTVDGPTSPELAPGTVLGTPVDIFDGIAAFDTYAPLYMKLPLNDKIATVQCTYTGTVE